MKTPHGIHALLSTVQELTRLDINTNKLVLTVPGATKTLFMFQSADSSRVAYLSVGVDDHCVMTLREFQHGGDDDVLRMNVDNPSETAAAIYLHLT